ncbi:MAG TPA: ester cyclase [Acidimicrobiales bacterium]|nr:ester cyclase [Acidimicrobiales bacterium]
MLCLEAVESNVVVLEEAIYAALEDEAVARSLRDPGDWPVVACAIALSAAVMLRYAPQARDGGDRYQAVVIVDATVLARFAGVDATGRCFRIDQAVITHLRDGKVAEAWEIADIAALKAQLAEDEATGDGLE